MIHKHNYIAIEAYVLWLYILHIDNKHINEAYVLRLYIISTVMIGGSHNC